MSAEESTWPPSEEVAIVGDVVANVERETLKRSQPRVRLAGVTPSRVTRRLPPPRLIWHASAAHIAFRKNTLANTPRT